MIINKKKGLYWNIVDEKEMKKILKIAKKNYKKAVLEMKISDYTKDYILNEKLRAKLAEFVWEKIRIKKAKILDIGSGFGALSIALAKKFDSFSVDTNPYTLKFIAYRAKQEKVKIRLKRIKGLPAKLPFHADFFNVVIMNGVLEWTASSIKGNVKKIYLKSLKECRRMLKNKGYLFLAIENRLAKDWFKGKTSHVNIKYIDLMPRFLADIIARKKTGKKFREHIYSIFGYYFLLKKADFKKIEFYEAFPSYQKPVWIEKTKNIFANSFIIAAQK